MNKTSFLVAVSISVLLGDNVDILMTQEEEQKANEQVLYLTEDGKGNYELVPHIEQKELNTSVKSDKQKTIMTYDAGHQQLQKVIDKLNEHANDLGRGDYIGYIHSTGQLYSYLLAIYYNGEDLLDSTYPYNYNFSSFEDLTDTYHKNIDFRSVELVNMEHKDFDIEIELSYINKITKEKGYLKYYISYGTHGLKDLSKF